MSEPNDRKQREEAANWLTIADEDAAAASTLIGAAPPLVRTAAYLCQQAAERLMKGLLTVAAVPFRKTHDLDELANLVEEAFPELAERLAPLRSRTSWGVAFRYPGVQQPGQSEPTPVEVAGTLEALAALRGDLAARAA